MASNPALTAYVTSSIPFSDPTHVVCTSSVLLVCRKGSIAGNGGAYAITTNGVAFTALTSDQIPLNDSLPAATASLLLVVPLNGSGSVSLVRKYSAGVWSNGGLPPQDSSSYFTGLMYRPFHVMAANDKIFAFCDLQDHQTNAVFYTTNGDTWTEINVPAPPQPIYDPARPYRRMYYKEGVYYLLSGKVAYYTSADLVTWTQHKFYNPYNYATVSAMPDIVEMYFTAYGGGDQIWYSQGVGELGGMARITSESGGIVVSTGSLSGSIQSLAEIDGGLIYITGYGGGVVYYYVDDYGVGVSGTTQYVNANYTYTKGVVFNGSLYLVSRAMFATLYNTGWVDDVPVEDLVVYGPTTTTYYQLTVGAYQGTATVSNVTYDVYTYLGPSCAGFSLQAAGGTPPYTWTSSVENALQATASVSPTVSDGGETASASLCYKLPAGIAGPLLYANGSNFLIYAPGSPTFYSVPVISGAATVRDSADPVADTATFQLTAVPRLGGGALSITFVTLPAATVGVAYSQSVGSVSGGTAPYTWTITSKSWAEAATITGGVLSTTFTTAGAKTFSVSVRDSSVPATTATGSSELLVQSAIPSLVLTLTNPLPDAAINTAYLQSVGAVSGGTAPYTWSISSKSWADAATITGGVLSTTFTSSGAKLLTVLVTDSSAPAKTVTGTTGVTVQLAVPPLSLSLTNPLPDATVDEAYSQSVGSVSGGTAPYTWSITSKSWADAATITGGVLATTFTTAGAKTLSVQVTDSSSPVKTATGTTGIPVQEAPPSFSLFLADPLPDALVGQSYSQLAGTVTGGTPPYSWYIISKSWSGNAAITNGVLTTTFTQAGAATFSVTVVDNGFPPVSASGTTGLTVKSAASPLSLFLINPLPNATAGVAYSQSVGSISGGTAPYTWSITSKSWGDSATITGGVLATTFTTAQANSFSVSVTDSSSPALTANGTTQVTVGQYASSLALTLSSALPDATVGVLYSQSIGSVSGGTAPYTWTITSKSWSETATITGGLLETTFATAEDELLAVSVTDSSVPPKTAGGTVEITVLAVAWTAVIQGTLRLDTSTGAFAARTVVLYNYDTHAKVAQTTSDAVTGAWEFTAVAPGSYFVVGVASSEAGDLAVPRDFDALGVITVT